MTGHPLDSLQIVESVVTEMPANVGMKYTATVNTITIPVGGYIADGITLTDELSGATYTVSNGNVVITWDGNLVAKFRNISIVE